MLLLVPCDPLNTRVPDAHFAGEAAAAAGLGWEVALIDHDMLTMGRAAEAVSAERTPRNGFHPVPRGPELRRNSIPLSSAEWAPWDSNPQPTG